MQGGWRKGDAGKLTVGCVGRGKGVRSRWTQETLARKEEGWTCSSYGTYMQPSHKRANMSGKFFFKSGRICDMLIPILLSSLFRSLPPPLLFEERYNSR